MTEEIRKYINECRKAPVPVIVQKKFLCGFCENEVGPLWHYSPMCGQKLDWKRNGNQ